MKRRFVLSALPAMLIALTGATRKKRAVPPPPPLGDTVMVEIVTELGTIVVELDHKRAPITVKNFMRYVDSGRYNGMLFYRAMHLSWGKQPNGLIQGGLADFPAKLLPPIAHEPTTVTGLTHVRGTLSMARGAPGTARSDFTIMIGDLTGLDANPKAADPNDQAGYAAFGKVITGMDVAMKIWESPRSASEGKGALKGEMLAPRIKVRTVRRAPVPQA